MTNLKTWLQSSEAHRYFPLNKDLPMRQFGSIHAGYVLSHRWITIFFMLVVAGLSTAGIHHLGFSADYKIYFDEDNPHLLAFEALQETYTKNDSVFIALAPEDGEVLTQKTLLAVADITERAWQTPHSVRVDSLSNFQHTEAEEDDLLVASLYKIDSSLAPDVLERIKKIALAEPFLRDRIVNDEASMTGINITIGLPEVDSAAAEAEVVVHVRQLKTYIESTYPRLKVYLTGTTMLNNAFLEATVHDFSKLIAFIPKNHIDDVFVRYFDERIEFRRHTEFVTENLTGIYFFDYSLQSGESGGIVNPQYLAQLAKFTDWLRQQPEVIHVNSLTDVFKRVNKSMHADQNEWYRLPEERNLAAQYLLIYEMSLPYGLDLNNQIDIDKRSSRVSVTTKTMSTMETLAFEKRIDGWMGNNIPELATTGASPVVMFSHIGLKNIISMLGGTSLALLAISFLLMWAFRSWRYGLITLIPNIAPAAMAFGLWGLIDGEVGLSLSIVAAMTLGVVVDDTIHFMNKFLLARREQGKSAIESVQYAFSQVGMALVVTTLALTAGFLVLATSAFSLNAEMGLLVAIVILLALAVDFLLLPCSLISFDQWFLKDQVRRSTAKSLQSLTKV